MSINEIVERSPTDNGLFVLYYEILKYPLCDFTTRCYIPVVWVDSKFVEHHEDLFVLKWSTFAHIVVALRLKLNLPLQEYRMFYIDLFKMCRLLDPNELINTVPSSTILRMQVIEFNTRLQAMYRKQLKPSVMMSPLKLELLISGRILRILRILSSNCSIGILKR
jgi:Ubiquitin-specific protease C-terminal